jgi:hypothetical protein
MVLTSEGDCCDAQVAFFEVYLLQNPLFQSPKVEH